MSKEQFIANLYPAAVKAEKDTGMSKELILAQAALETGWGEKVLPGTNNTFNIKASPDWHGPTKTFRVPETVDGKTVMMDSAFRVYGSIQESVDDRIKFLKDNPRYANSGLFDEGAKGNLEKEANALQKAGFATNKDYAEKLVEVYHGPTMRRGIALAGPITDKDHAGNAMYAQAFEGMQALDAESDRKSDQFTANAAAALAVEAHRNGLKHIDHVLFGETNADNIYAVQGKLGTAHSTVISVDTVGAVNTPLIDTSRAYVKESESHAQNQQNQQQHQPDQQQQQPAMKR